jgi:hypothetical protein
MSALEYLNIISQKITKDDIKPVDKKEKKKYKHGNNVIMKTGTYKGYYGYVYDFIPAKVEVETEDQQYINAKSYGKQNIGSTIMTEFGESTIIDKKLKSYILTIDNPEITDEKQKKIKIRLNTTDVLHLIQYKKDNLIKFGIYITSDENTINISPIKLNYGENTPKSDLINEISKRIKENDFYTAEPQKINKSEILFPDLYFIKKDKYIGQYAIELQVVPEQYLITYKKQINLLKSQLKRKTSTLYEILSGPYKGKTCEIKQLYPAHLIIYIDAAGKKVSKHMVKENNNYIERHIYPSDVFYMDLILNNGNMFEVKEITNNIIIGLEKTEKGLIPRQITESDIESLQPGFAFTKNTMEKMKLEESIYSYGDPMYEEKEFEEDDENNQLDEYIEEEIQESDEENEIEEVPETEIDTRDEQIYKSSYKDIERITFEGKTLTKEQQKIKTKIEKITTTFGISNLDEYKLIQQIDETIKNIKKELKSANIEFWNISDEKYIIAALVIFNIIKSGFGSLIYNENDDILSSYLYNLITGTRPFFNKKDYNNSIFAKSGWTTSFEANEQIFKSLLNSKDHLEIHKYILSNCLEMIEKIYGKINLDIQPKKQESLTVLGKRKYEDEPRKRITVKDIFTKNVTPDANKILWGIAYQPLLDKYKSKLIEKINDPNSNKTTKLVYDYVLQNLERGLFAVEEIKKLSNESKSQIDILKFDKMSKIWQSLLNDAKIIYNKLEKEKVSKIQEIEKEKEALKLKRETISAAKKLKSIELSDDEDDLTELKSDKKYPPYLERIAKKRGF